MANLVDFVAFKAAIDLLNETKQNHIINEVYNKSKENRHLPADKLKNFVKDIYKPFTPAKLSEKITQILTPENVKAKVTIIYQTIEDLHDACPDNKGDWYFTGNYPTPGGNKVVNNAFINYIEGRKVRAY